MADESSHGTDETQAARRSAPAWLVYPIGGVVAAVAVYLAMQAVYGPLRLELPEGYADQASAEYTQELLAEANAIMIDNRNQNWMRLYLAVGLVMGVVFGVFGGIHRKRGARILIGAIAGALAGVVAGYLIFLTIVPLVESAVAARRESFVQGVYVHVVAWSIFGLAAGIAVACSAGTQLSKSLGAILTAAIAGGVGGLLFVLVVGTVAPDVEVDEPAHREGFAMLTWAALPPIMIGLAFARGLAIAEPHVDKSSLD